MRPHDDDGAPAWRSQDAAEPSVGDPTSVTDLEAWIAERKAAREAQHGERQAWLKRANGEHRQARAYGLRARHALAAARRRRGYIL